MSTGAESRAVEEFRSAALAYCRLLEDIDTIELSAFVRSCHESLAKLYLAGLSLPLVEPGTEDATHRRDYARWKVVYDTLARKLGDHNLYWLVFDPCDRDDRRAIQHTLADDLAGVYDDVKEGLEPWPPSTNTEADDRVWDWRFGFENNWGRYAGNAIRVLWSLIYQHLDADEQGVESA